jgi:porin
MIRRCFQRHNRCDQKNVLAGQPIKCRSRPGRRPSSASHDNMAHTHAHLMLSPKQKMVSPTIEGTFKAMATGAFDTSTNTPAHEVERRECNRGAAISYTRIAALALFCIEAGRERSKKAVALIDPRLYSFAVLVTAVVLNCCWGVSANAQSLPDWLTQTTMTGDWGGLRTKLEEEGVIVVLESKEQAAGVLSGGKSPGTDASGDVGGLIVLDTYKLMGLPGGTFHVGFDQRWGRDLSADHIGDELQTQFEFGAGAIFRLNELSYDQLFGGEDGKLFKVKAGYFPIGNDFANGGPVLFTFMSSYFCCHMESMAFGSGWGDWPIASWGGDFRVNLTPDFYAQAGVFDVDPRNIETFYLGVRSSTGAITAAEVGWNVALGPDALPGHYKLGGFYDTSHVPDIGNAMTLASGRYGGYILGDQMLWSFGSNAQRGFIAFAGASIGDAATAPIENTFHAGFLIRGPFASRPTDYINFGYSRVGVNHRAIDAQQIVLLSQGITDFNLPTGDSDIEFGYGLQLAPWLLLHPNIQYIDNPGAFSFTPIRNAWVFGFETRVYF